MNFQWRSWLNLRELVILRLLPWLLSSSLLPLMRLMLKVPGLLLHLFFFMRIWEPYARYVLHRYEAETFLGTNMLKPEKETFLNFWKMSRFFHMKILDSFLDCLCLDNFGWFTTTLPLLCPQYLASWPLDKLGNFLAQQRFANCSEEQIFLAVVSYCRTKSGQHSWDELAPGLYRSCGAYLRYIQSVPRMLPCKTKSSSWCWIDFVAEWNFKLKALSVNFLTNIIGNPQWS